MPIRTITYPIHEMFYTFQGEGCHAGKPAFFIRTFGCPVKCPWCDSAGTWHPKWVPKDVKKMTVEELLNAVGATDMVVITGGEPAIHNLKPLVDALHNEDKRVHIETSGAFQFHPVFNWVTLSPKRWKLPMEDNIVMADEFKFIIEKPEDIDYYTTLLLDMGCLKVISSDIWLHPEWSQRNNVQVLEAITKAVKRAAYPYRAGWQLHKLYKADEQDTRSRPAVPLGGVSE